MDRCIQVIDFHINVRFTLYISSFMDNLQTEVLELEFNEFSKGMPTISEVEFANILLRYTILTAEENEEYLQRMKTKVEDVKVLYQDVVAS